MNKDSNIIVCGAGPVGLLSALKFAQAGIDVTVIEAEPAINDSPRACVYTPAALEAFDAIGIFHDLKNISHINQTFGFYSPSDDWLMINDSAVENAGPYDRSFHVGQEEVGAILVKHLERQENAQILWSTRLTGITQSNDKVTLEVDTPEGPKTMVANWLVGTDGANSTVRRLCDIEFEGHTWDDRFFATNVNYDFSKLGYGDGVMRMDPHSYAVIVRVNKSGVWRIAFGEDASLPIDSCVERAHARLNEFIPEGEQYDVLRLSPYSIHQRAAQTLRRGRVILAGDAAHATNPVGGLGLTTGSWDAIILGDLLPEVVKGNISEGALDAYSKERLRVFWEFTSPQASENKRVIQEADPERRAQDRAMLVGMLSSKEAKAVAPKLAYLTVGDPILKNSPWQKYKDPQAVAATFGLKLPPMRPKP